MSIKRSLDAYLKRSKEDEIDSLLKRMISDSKKKHVKVTGYRTLMLLSSLEAEDGPPCRSARPHTETHPKRGRSKRSGRIAEASLS
jgi:hypothetical protein